jgi:hypothetical protein
MNPEPSSATRQTLFISKATPGDDAFALWLAPRLEAQGYRVFADILSFEAGDRWRKKSGATTSYPGIILRPLARLEDVLPYNAVWLPGNDNPAMQRFLSLTRSLPDVRPMAHSPEGAS